MQYCGHYSFSTNKKLTSFGNISYEGVEYHKKETYEEPFLRGTRRISLMVSKTKEGDAGYELHHLRFMSSTYAF